MAGLSAPHFHPILTDTGNGPSFTMLGTTMRLIATAAGTGGRYTVLEQVTPAGWVHRVTSIHVKTRFFTFSRALTSCMSAMSVGPFPLAPVRSCHATFHTAFATWHPRPADC